MPIPELRFVLRWPTAPRHRSAAGRALTLAGLLLAAAACAPTTNRATSPAAGSASLVREAQAFMASYAQDLRAGERDRLADRYDPRGAWFVGQGRKELMPADSIRAMYRGGWGPPASFEWEDLSYEAVGPDAVVVAGRFVWGARGGQRLTFSYTALLLRRDGRLRIRLEDESGAPPPARSP